MDRSLTSAYSYSPYSMNYHHQGSDAQSYQSSTPSYMQASYSPQFHPSNNMSSPSSQNFLIASPSSHYQHHQQHFSHHTTKAANSIRYGSNSELNKRTRNHSHGYELSQDLIDKQIELLERKYGGKIRAQRAALVSFLLLLFFALKIA